MRRTFKKYMLFILQNLYFVQIFIFRILCNAYFSGGCQNTGCDYNAMCEMNEEGQYHCMCPSMCTMVSLCECDLLFNDTYGH